VTQKKIAIATGGTAGHVAPALAVAGALRADGAEVAFIGGRRAEAEMVPAAGFELRTISVEGVSRTNPLRAARALARAALAVPRARTILKDLAPDAVLGGGGYVAGPVGLAALSLRIPLVLTEADSHLGLANRLLAHGAKRVCLAFPISGRDAPARYRVTGRPIPFPDADRARARAHFEIGEEETCVLVFGGSLGARSINLAAVQALPDADCRVLHVAGRRDYEELRARELPAGYDLREYLDLEEFAMALAAADLVLARSGGSVFEIAAYGLPAILVPYPHASADHQSANAKWMTEAGAAVTIPDGELTGQRLAGELAALLGDRARLTAMARASRGLARPRAAKEVAEELLAAASSRRAVA
jgi:UDP-N-acetylglucosamine--N-acetylmuramyl-(pentapeptide) pyrophosphoryl-undecaprenol N-acetylglucosamine transferase